MRSVQNIIFDLGGVLLNIDFNLTIQAFKNLGFPHFEKMYSQFTVDQLFEKLEKGEISTQDFYTVMKSVGNEGLTEEDIKMSWNSLLLDFRIPSLEFVKELAKTKKIFLLSNTNAIHYEAFNIILQEETGLASLDGFFLKSYYSHLMGMRKPDNNIFDFVLEDAKIKAADSLFIDDTATNISAAQNMGFQTHLLVAGERIENLEWTVI